jgi:hypothetical protein
MKKIAMTFTQLKDYGLSLDLFQVTVQQDGRIFGLIKNQSRDLRATKPWGIVITDARAKAPFLVLEPGTYQVEAFYD